ncbi:MAG: DUF4281 domain-containing protein [Rhizobiaceae bacterium]|nr:DUF4281 domain-containing protein [Rhizobiaceae bacterium]
MDTELMFGAANLFVLAGWAALLASPFAPRFADIVGGAAVPLLLAVAYTGLVLAFWTRAEGGFGSLADVATLFQTPQMLLAGWIHYLAYDLFVGAWIVRTARREGIAFWMVVPLLVPAFLFGPVGYLAFSALRAALVRRSAVAA